MNISVTVGILILTVFLSLSAPAYAGTSYPYPVFGFVDDVPDGTLVTLYEAGDSSNSITVEVGSSYGVSGGWKADLYNMPGSVDHGDSIIVTVPGKSAKFVVDTSVEGMKDRQALDLTTKDNSGGNSNSGTYPPTPTATSTPTAASESTETSTETSIGASTGATTDAPTATQTKITTEFKTQSTPGFGAVSTVFAIAGLLVVTYLVMRRRE